MDAVNQPISLSMLDGIRDQLDRSTWSPRTMFMSIDTAIALGIDLTDAVIVDGDDWNG